MNSCCQRPVWAVIGQSVNSVRTAISANRRLSFCANEHNSMPLKHFLPVCCIALAACAAQPALAPESDRADVVVYRTAIPIGPDGDVAIYDGDQLVGKLSRGCYQHLSLTPGARKLTARVPGTDALPYATTLAAGKHYYLMIYYRGRGSVGDFELLPQDMASANAVLPQLAEVTAASP